VEQELSGLAINQATTLPQWGLREAVRGYSRAGIHAISVWSDQVTKCGLATAQSLLRDHGMTVPAYCFATGSTTMPMNRSGELYDLARAALDEAAAVQAECFIMMLGGASNSRTSLHEARQRASDFLSRLVLHGLSIGVSIGIEPVHPMRAADLSCINTMRQANDLCDVIGPGASVVVDVYHVWWDQDLEEEINRASGRISSFQISDWLAGTASVKNDRGMMGDGVIDIRSISRMVRAAEFDGPCEVEIMSERNWGRRPPEEVLDTCISRFRDLVAEPLP
jgi:sugar phosphate isomerase/epimerase